MSISFFKKESFSEEDINNLIRDGIEESLYLDFKASGSLSKDDKKKKEIGKDVSAFANSDGGIIIYGLKEEDHKASEITFIDGTDITKEWLQQIIDSNIQRRIDGLKIFPIRFDNDLKKTVYLVKIPASNNVPHMASDNRFYKRYNFQSMQMDEYEIRGLYNQQSKTKLSIDDVIVIGGSSTYNGTTKKINYSEHIIKFQVRNESQAIESLYKLEVLIPISFLREVQHANPIKQYYIRDDDNYSVFSIPNKSPLFQNELTTVCECRVQFSKNNYKDLSKYFIKVKLYFTNGIDEREFNISDRLTFSHLNYRVSSYEDYL